LVHLLSLVRLVSLPPVARQIKVSCLGVLAFLAVVRLVARSSSVIDSRSIAAKVYLTMVEVNPTTVEVESMTLYIKLTVV
jgi:hypothetical protein